MEFQVQPPLSISDLILDNLNDPIVRLKLNSKESHCRFGPGLQSLKFSDSANDSSSIGSLVVRNIHLTLSKVGQNSASLSMAAESLHSFSQIQASHNRLGEKNLSHLTRREEIDQETHLFNDRIKSHSLEFKELVPRTSQSKTPKITLSQAMKKTAEAEMKIEQLDKMIEARAFAVLNNVVAYPFNKAIELSIESTSKVCQSHPSIQTICDQISQKVTHIYQSALSSIPSSWKKEAASFFNAREKMIETEANFFKEQMGIPKKMTRQYHADSLENFFSIVMLGGIPILRKSNEHLKKFFSSQIFQSIEVKPSLKSVKPSTTIKKEQPFPKRGEIYWTDLEPTKGSETQKIRPGLIISNDIGNKESRIVMIAPITSKVARVYHQFEVQTTVGKKPAKIMLNQSRAIDKCRILKKIGEVDSQTMKAAEEAMKFVLGIEKTKK